MNTTAEYVREWDMRWEQAGRLAERLKEPGCLRKTIETAYVAVERKKDAKEAEPVPESDKRVQQIFDFFEQEIGRNDLNRRNFAMQLLCLEQASRPVNGKIVMYFNHGYGNQGSPDRLGLDVEDLFDKNQKLTPLGREILRHEGPLGHGSELERLSLYERTEWGAKQPKALFNDRQAGLISNVTEAKATVAQCLANFEAGEPVGVNALGFEKALTDVLNENHLTVQQAHDLKNKNADKYQEMLTEIKKRQFLDVCIHRARTIYQPQTITSMNYHGKGKANTPLFKKFFECTCRSIGLDGKNTMDLWQNFEPYVLGIKEMPGFAFCFNKQGQLDVKDRSSIKTFEDIRRQKTPESPQGIKVQQFVKNLLRWDR